MKDVLVFSTDKYEEFMRANFLTEFAEKVIKNSKGWRGKCEGLTPEEMHKHGFMCDDTWLVKKNELKEVESNETKI